jgi:hypothetical protein
MYLSNSSSATQGQCCSSLLFLTPACLADVWLWLAVSLYLQLQGLYRDQADSELAAVEAHLNQIIADLGSPGRSISSAEVKHFCRNARNIRVVRCG